MQLAPRTHSTSRRSARPALIAAITITAIIAASCGGTSTSPSDEATPVEPEHEREHDHDHDHDGENDGEGATIEDQLGDCILPSLLLATDLIDVATQDAVTIASQDKAEGEDGAVAIASVDLAGGATIRAAESRDYTSDGKLSLQIFFDHNTDALTQALPDPDGLTLLSLRRPTIGAYLVGMVRTTDETIEAWDECATSWRDVTEDFTRAARAIDTPGTPLDVLSTLAEDATGELSEAFGFAWAPDDELAAWTDRPTDQRYFTDPEVPDDLRDQLVAVRLDLVYNGPDMSESPLAVCPRQDQAVNGYCVSLEVLSIDRRIVLEVPAMPGQPIELWIHDERREPAGPHTGPVAIITDPQREARVDIAISGTESVKELDRFSETATLLVNASDANLLADPESEGIAFAGGVDPVHP